MPPRPSIDRLRTFGIVAHVDAGKTTLTERILHATGRIRLLGAVDEGNTTTDHDPREKARGITIGAAAVSLTHGDHELSLVDTPGHVDFGVEVARSLRVLDAAVVVLDAVAGVEPQTESVWARADEYALPRLVFVNKLDRPGADFDRAVGSLEQRLGVRGLPLVVPSPNGRSLVDLVRKVAIDPAEHSLDRTRPLEGEEAEVARVGHARIEEVLADLDEDVLTEVVSREAATEETLVRALRRATIERSIVPILAGSAKAGLGVGTLLDAIVSLLPSPLDRGAIVAEGGEASPPVAKDPLVAFAFKTIHDEYGQRTFVRVYAGTLRKGASVLAVRAGRTLRVGRVARLFGDSIEDVDAIGPGEIAAILGLGLQTGETLADPSRPVVLESVSVPAPVLGVALEPCSSDDRSRMGPALRRLLSDDPSLALVADPATGETVLSGLGELHLEVTLEKLASDCGVRVRASRPRVAYRETITKKGEAEEVLSKQTGGPGQFAHVRLRVEPGSRGSGFAFADASVGGVVPRAFVPAVEAGARAAAEAGVVAGYPVDDVVVTLLGGSFHSNDSNEHAFHAVARVAFARAARAAEPVLLEPVMQLDVVVPEPNLGDVLGDLAGRRGRVEELGARGAQRVVTARAPFAELLGYVTDLRSRTQGRGSTAMKLLGYEIVPSRVAELVIRKA